MFLNLCITVTTVLTASVFAETLSPSYRDQEISGPYQPSGWRPSGPAFRLPERPPLPLTYGPPENSFEASTTNKPDVGVEEQRRNLGRQVHLTYRLPKVGLSNQVQKENYETAANIQFNQPKPLLSFSNVNEERKEEHNVDLNNREPQDTLSVPRDNPAVTYGPPVVESNSGLPGSARKSGKEFQGQDSEHQSTDFQEGSGSDYTQNQEDLKVRFLQPNTLPNQPSERRNGIEYQVDLTYGAPQETFVVPPNEPAVTYGPPEEVTISTTTQPESTTTELPTTTETSTETDQEEKEKSTLSDEENVVKRENLREAPEDVIQEPSVYYIYHPSGLLQKVLYSAEDDQANMAYSARLKYENVEPIRGPVYTYDPQTYVFSRLY